MPKAFPSGLSRFFLVSFLAIAALVGPTPRMSHAADGDLLQLGDIAVSGFAGVKLQVEGLQPGVDPLTKTVIDPDGVTLRVYGGGPVVGPLAGQQLDLPLRKDFKAKDIGHVFALVFDTLPADERGTPGLYAGATSSFGLNIFGPDKDGDGQPDRLTKGGPGAKFMEGQFGEAAFGGAGAIWKVDSATGELSLYAELSQPNGPNSGPGIGGLAFDPSSRSLYVSDLDTGLIHQLKGLNTGTEVNQFDHGVQARPLGGKDAVADDGKRLNIASPNFDTANPTTWGITQNARRIDGLAVHGGRLYYAVAEGPEIWSVGLAPDGSFLQDARIEVGVTTAGPGTITTIAFDRSGDMVLAPRNAVQNTGDFLALVASGPTDVMRYAPETPDDPQTASAWQPDPLTYPVGQSPERRDGSGGVALQYAYKPGGSLDLATCDGVLLASGDALNPQRTVHGLQIGEASQFQTTTGANIPTAFIALDPAQDDAAARGHAGGVAVLSQCKGGGFPPVASEGTQFPAIAGGGGGGGQPGFPPVEGGGGQVAPVEGGGGQVNFPPVEGGGGQVNIPEGGGGQVNVPEGGGGRTRNLSLAKTAAVAKCSPDGGCAFNIEVLNNGPEVPGPITINELIEAPQAVLTGQPDPPWRCSKAAPFTCTHPGPVPANGKLTMHVVFAPHTPAEAKEIKNCVAMAGAAAPPGGQNQPGAPPAGQNQPGAPQAGQNQPQVCATIPLDQNAPAQAGPVVFTKKGPATCPIIGPCTFEITLANMSDAPVPGPIPFLDTLDIPGAKLSDAPIAAPFKCDKAGPPFNCTFGSADQGLGPHETKTLSLTFDLDLPEGTKSLKNCVVKPAAPAPQKKAELTAPMSRRPLLTEASFRPQLFTGGNGLLYFVANPGKNCTRWGAKDGALKVLQSNGLQIAFSKLEIDEFGRVNGGRASYRPKNGGPLVSGTVTGNVNGNDPVLHVVWDNGDTGEYKFAMAADGSFTGNHANAAGVEDSFENDGSGLICKSSKFCETYADKVDRLQFNIMAAGCSPDDPDLWFKDKQGILDFCLSRASTTDPLFEAKNKARQDAIDKCVAMKEARAPCEAFANAVVKMNEQMKVLDCPDALPNLTVKGAINVCLLKPGSDVAARQTMQKKLDACKAAFAAGGAGAGGQGFRGGPGGAADAAGQEPAPEQCAVVQIKDVQPQGGGGVVIPGPKTSKAGPLSLNKTAGKNACADTHCEFIITIANTSDAEFKGPIEFSENVFGDARIFNSTTVSAASDPKFDCVKQGTAFACANPAVTLAANKSISIAVTADLGKDAGNAIKEMRNCAMLKASGGPSCATAQFPPPAPPKAPDQPKVRSRPSTVGTFSLVKTFSKSPCVGNSCVFNITISNVGQNGGIDSPMTFFDEVTGDGKSFAGATVTVAPSPQAKFTCFPDPKGFACFTNKATIAPKGSLSLTVTADLGKDASGIKVMTNCAMFKGAAEPSCDTAPLQTPAPAPVKNGAANLAAQVTAPNAGADGVGVCSINSACRFTVRVSSNGTVPTKGTSSFDTKVDNGPVELIGAKATANAGGFACGAKGADGQTVSCQTGTELPPQSFLNTDVSVLPGITWKKNDTLTLCANLTAPDSNAADDRACASVKLDPFNVKVTKTGDQSCTLGGDCNFTIKLFNPGPIDHNAPVTISDNLTGLSSAQIVSISPPLPCAAQPSQIPFSCTSSGPVRLDLGASEGSEFGPRNFKMVVRLPGNSRAKQFSNCAEVSDGTPSGSSQSCLTVSLEPPVQTCLAGMVMTNGTCVCPPNTEWKNTACKPVTGTGGLSTSKQPTPNTGSGGIGLSKQPASGPGNCAEGEYYRDGKCRYRLPAPAETKCKAGLVKDAKSGKCVACERGKHAEGNSCVPDKVKQKKKKQPEVCPPERPVAARVNGRLYCCPEGSRYRHGQCSYPRPAAPAEEQQRRDNEQMNQPECPPGYVLSEGECQRFRRQRPPRNQQPEQPQPEQPQQQPQQQQQPPPPPPQRQCAPPRVGPNCVCPAGMKENFDHTQCVDRVG